MTAAETKKIVKKIKIFRPFFQSGNGKQEEKEFIGEWHKVLKVYDYEDVDHKLDEYFNNGNNYGKIPDIHYLVKYLQTTEQKKTTGGIIVNCPRCGVELPLEEIDKHNSRCSSVSYLCMMSKKYFHQKLNRQKLFDLPDDEFDRKYLAFKKQLENKIPKEEQKELKKIFKEIGG